MIVFFRNVFYYFALIRIIPVICSVWFSDKKDYILKDILLYNRKTNGMGVSFMSLSKLLYLDPYYRAIFYHKAGKRTKIFRFLLPPEDKITISQYVVFKGAVFAAHPYSTYINAKEIGDNFSFRHCTTLGNKSDDKPNDIPTIGDNVTLGAHVIILGNVHVGNNVIVGAGSVVVKDIPDNCVVAGNPAKIIKKL